MENNDNNTISEGRDYNGEERRRGFCPVHHLKCHQIRDVEIKTSKRVPIWVFVVFISGLTGVLGFLNYDSIRRHDEVMDHLGDHVEKANIVLENNSRVLGRVTHSLNEVALNQQEVMKVIDLEFRRIPRYDNGK